MRYKADLFHRGCHGISLVNLFSCMLHNSFVQSRTMFGCTFARLQRLLENFSSVSLVRSDSRSSASSCVVALELDQKFSNEVSATMALRVIANVLFML